MVVHGDLMTKTQWTRWNEGDERTHETKWNECAKCNRQNVKVTSITSVLTVVLKMNLKYPDSLSFLLPLLLEENFRDSSPMWAQGNPSAPLIPLLPHFLTPSFGIFYFSFFFVSYSLNLFSCFSIPSHSTRIVPTKPLFFGVDFMLYVFLVKDACLCFPCGLTVVSPVVGASIII